MTLNVMIAGLTAVGKTTHSRILARQLGYDVVGATEYLLSNANFDTTRGHPWLEHLTELEAQRDREGSIDDAVDAALCADTRTLACDAYSILGRPPWLSPAPALRIKLVSTPIAAARKVYVSQGLNRKRNLSECMDHMLEKNRSK